MGGEIRYCITDDGVRIAYRVKGEGPPLVVAPFFMESFSLLHRMPSLSQFLDRLAEGRTLIQYDTRGTGLSQRGSKDFSPRALAADIAAVVRDVGERQIMVWGSHGGTIRGMAFAIYYPELVFKLAMYTPLPVNTAYFPVQALHAMASLWRTDPKTAARNMADAAMREQQPALALQMARLLEESVEGESVARFLESAAGGEWDLLDALSSITAPSLIVHRTGDQTPFEMARKTSELIPNSRLVQIDSPPFLDDPFELLRVVDGFLDKQGVETDGPQSWPGAFRTVS